MSLDAWLVVFLHNDLTEHVTYWFVTAAISPDHLYDNNVIAKINELHKVKSSSCYLAIIKKKTNKLEMQFHKKTLSVIASMQNKTSAVHDGRMCVSLMISCMCRLSCPEVSYEV